MSELDIRKWLSDVTESVKEKDLQKHMNLVSENVVVYGMPKAGTLNYADWYKRRKSEFKRNILKDLTYHNLKVKNFGLRRITFNIEEVMDGSNGDVAILEKLMILEQEEDEQWRVVEETIKNWKFIKASN